MRQKHVLKIILFLSIYIPFEGFILKIFPPEIGSILRYIPEVIIYYYFFKFVILKKLLKSYKKNNTEKIFITLLNFCTNYCIN